MVGQVNVRDAARAAPSRTPVLEGKAYALKPGKTADDHRPPAL